MLILLLAASLRLFKLGQISPPGLNQDEAQNAWTAQCLIKTGKDPAGVSWPIFYTRGLGDNSPILYIYLLIPFQALGGMNAFTTRLPGALGGIFTIWMIYFVAKRLFDTPTGLAAAAILTLNPWHLQQSRWGHEASINPLLGLAPLALMLWAGLPISNNKTITLRPVIAAVGGALAGTACYGYQAVRLFIPGFLLAIVLFTLSNWLQTLKTRKGILAISAFIITFAAAFGPLAYQHVFHPEGIGRHISHQPHWVGSATLWESVTNIIPRYIQHFGPDFMFIKGDHFVIQGPPVGGQFHWYELPLMLVGLAGLTRKFKSSLSHRIVLAFVLAYPVGDCFGWNILSIHSLRSAPGLCGLILLSAVGVINIANWLSKQNRNLALTTIILFASAIVGLNMRFFYHFYGEFNRRPEIFLYYHTDFVDACKWLKPRFDDFDAVFCTTEDLNMPYVVSLVALNYDPNRWFNEPKDFYTKGEFDYYTRYGKMYFMYKDHFNPPEEQYLAGRVLLIIRPGEIDISDPQRQIIHKISRPDGIVTLCLCRI